VAESLDSKVVVITGGSGLIGSTFVRAVAGAGGLPVIADRNLPAAEELRSSLRAEGLESEAVDLDITSRDSWTAAFSRLKEGFGKVDAVVNCAYPKGKGYGKRFEDVTYEEFNESVDPHLGGYFLGMQRAGVFFEAQGFGNIVNIASIYGVIAPRFQIYAGTPMTTPVQYAAIKAGVIHLTRYVARYYQGKGIRCNCISPGGILDRQPESFLRNYGSFCSSKGMLVPGDLAGALIFLVSDASRYMNGQNLVVDDGFTL
jgi:NAD(P)-dependent dehydrogenase (short-subunit alcohol dehydrogenase family)